MQAALTVSRAIDGLNRRLAHVVAWLTLLMVLVGAFNAIARKVGPPLGLSLSSNAYLELQWYLFSLVFLLGAPYTLRMNGHVRVDILYAGHRPKARAWIDLVGTLLFLLPFCAMAIWYSWEYAAISVAEREISSDPSGLWRWPLKAVMPAAFILVALQGISEAIKRVGILRGLSADEVELEEPSLEAR
jgi:TRAP-type mannitol/chloroaromatic compound transport system permease small subunit